MSEESVKVASDFEYAEPHGPLGYEPFRQDYVGPNWKDPAGLYAKRPVRDLGTERHRDKEVYWSREIMELEWKRLWSNTWLMVGHLSDIPKPNAFMKVDIGPESFLVVRKNDDEVEAIYNVCQHRGTRLVANDFGTAKKFTCPFHKWEFSNSGELLKIADKETFRTQALCHDLNIPKIRVAAWRGWIFINMEPNAEPLEQFLGADFMETMRAYDFEKGIRIRDITQEWPVNWKAAHEGFSEGYHVQAIHPQLLAALDAYHAQVDLYENGHARSMYQFMSPTPQAVSRLPRQITEEHKIFLREAGLQEHEFPEYWSDVAAAVVEGKRRKKGAIDYSKFSAGQLIDSWGMGFFPCSEHFMYPEGFFIQHWLPHPTDPEKCYYRAQVYAIPGIGELPSFMGVDKADMSGRTVLPRTFLDPTDLKSLGPVISQDRMTLPRVQQGMHSRGFKGAVFSEQEVRIRYFYDEYYRYLRGHKGGERD
jgi:phenylpropionate dioxygenase-like ring-hydroxylating dioxygenase large terminal subunit